MHVKYSYLDQQFINPEPYFDDLRELVASGEFTLGPFVEKFEQKFAQYIGVKHVIGTNTGTDALILALKAAGVGSGDEVISVPNTFYATIGAVIALNAVPIFVDCDQRMQIDVEKLEAAITPKTKAILPVHWMGCPADMHEILVVAEKHGLMVIEDACAAAGAKIGGKRCGSFGNINAFSMHPLKPLNVWGDGGMVATNDDEMAAFLRLYHNHGLVDRDHIKFWGINSRLQPFQAVIASRQLDKIEEDITSRINNAGLLDEKLKSLEGFVVTPPRKNNFREVYQIYAVRVQRRNELVSFLTSRDIECKIHYPVPLHLQQAALSLGYSRGDFPECEIQADEIITLPAHHYISEQQINYMVDCISDFYQK
jgi:dTDP-4-amino-4,6-dideoxygalactose transaminase